MSDWLRSNRLQLNTAKTEIFWCSSTRRLNQLPSATFHVGENYVLPLTTVRDLGLFIDNDVTMRSYVSRTVSGCFAVLRQLCSIRCLVSDSCVSFAGHIADHATSRLQQCNSLMTFHVPAPLTSVGTQRRRQTDTSISSMLRDLHWL